RHPRDIRGPQHVVLLELLARRIVGRHAARFRSLFPERVGHERNQIEDGLARSIEPGHFREAHGEAEGWLPAQSVSREITLWPGIEERDELVVADLPESASGAEQVQ